MTTDRPISPTTISHYVRLERCERYLRFRLRPDEVKTLKNGLKHLRVEEQPLTPLLREAGNRFEDLVVKSLPGPLLDLKDGDAATTLTALTSLMPGGSLMLVQAAVDGEIGGRRCEGRADIVRATRRDDGAVDLLVADVKASRKDRVEHRLQVGFYARLLSQMLESKGLRVGATTGAILKIDEQGALPALDDPINIFDLEPYYFTLSQLMEGADSDVARIEAQDFDAIPYSLSYKCDSCMFNQICMADSSARHDVAITPFVRPAEVRALRAAGIRTLRELGELKVLPGPNDWNTAFRATPGREVVVAALGGREPVGANLDRLVQRARAILHRLEPDIASHGHLLDGAWSQLPGDDKNPDLIKIFLDAQHDYLSDRIYMVGALVKGPRGAVPIVHMTDGPPTDAAEADVLMRLLIDVLAAVPSVASDPEAAPIHIYVYDAYDQKVWLDALDRHMQALFAVPAFYDLLTKSPALGQRMVSMLAAEVRDRRNLALTCQNLYNVAGMLGFKWFTEEYDFRRLFYLRVFDNRARIGGDLWVERASRFNSHIPLEYAYGAWGTLPEDGTYLAPLTDRYYRAATPALVQAFEAHRLASLAHIETELKNKDERLIKEPVALAGLGLEPVVTAGLALSLEEFLLMEHHSTKQERLALYGLPIERRVQTGRALLLLCTAVEKIGDDLVGRFRVDFASLGLDSAVVESGSRIKEGDWMVLNPADGRSPWRTIHGRIAVVRSVENSVVDLKLLNMTSFGSDFKYSHDAKLVPAPGERYTLDEMADELNADKFRDAVRNAESNVFYNWLSDATPQANLGPISGRLMQLLERIEQLEGAATPTSAQRRVIVDHYKTPLLAVQGPPGSGKTATLGWAVLARLFARDERPLRVAVCARTHKATNLVLESIAKRSRKLTATREGKALGDVLIYKVGGGDGDEMPKGVRHIDTYTDFGEMGRAFDAPLLVVGGTPGGIYSLVKARQGRKVDWTTELFDLVIVDEASQMSLPEAVLAGAFLKPDGQMIVVGDHRQMPPILSHDWAGERKRSSQAHQPQRSVFETLLERGFPVVRLDESFRLHKVQAEFLAQNIYNRDGIPYFSRRLKALPESATPLDAYVAAALDSDYPAIVIEHNESGSQQYNDLEIALASPLISALSLSLGLDGLEGIGVVVPHRAQKAALRRAFPDLAKAEAIDTVERFQGGERDVIIVSATASDHDYVLSEAKFLLNLNRLNVAISRPRLKLIVIASTTIFRLLMDDVDLFDNAVLWKRLRYNYATVPLWNGQIGGYEVRMFGKHGGGRGTGDGGQGTRGLEMGPLEIVRPVVGRKKAAW